MLNYLIILCALCSCIKIEIKYPQTQCIIEDMQVGNILTGNYSVNPYGRTVNITV